MKTQGRILGVHLLNDLSGSPLVFSMVLNDYVIQGNRVELFTSEGNGFLSDLKEVKTHTIPYKWSSNKAITLLNFSYVQFWLFVKLLFSIKKNDTVYVNTLLPFGALLAAKFRGVHTIQHMHEVSVKPALLFRFLCFISEYTTREMIFVSAYLKSCFKFKRPIQRVVHNKLDQSFIKIASENKIQRSTLPFTVLMLCSLKTYKGVYVFLRLAQALPNIRFKMLLNASDKDILDFVLINKPSVNCEIISPTRNTHPYYQQAHVLVNLSLPDQWIETFGMTILEAKEYGLKVIAPPVGGPAEIVEVPKDGFLVDSRNEFELIQKIELLFSEFKSQTEKSKENMESFKSVKL